MSRIQRCANENYLSLPTFRETWRYQADQTISSEKNQVLSNFYTGTPAASSTSGPEPKNEGVSFHEASPSILPSRDSKVRCESVLRIQNEMIRVSDAKLDYSPGYQLGGS